MASSIAIAPRKTGVARTMICAGVTTRMIGSSSSLVIQNAAGPPLGGPAHVSIALSGNQLAPARAANLVALQRRRLGLARLHTGVAADDDLPLVAVGGHDRRHTDYQERPEIRADRRAIGRGAGANVDFVQP